MKDEGGEEDEEVGEQEWVEREEEVPWEGRREVRPGSGQAVAQKGKEGGRDGGRKGRKGSMGNIGFRTSSSCPCLPPSPSSRSIPLRRGEVCHHPPVPHSASTT